MSRTKNNEQRAENNEKGKVIVMEQKINSRKTDSGYYVEVLHDGKVVWTDTFEKEERLKNFIKVCNDAESDNNTILSQEEGRKLLESGKYHVIVFYRHPLGWRFAPIYNNDAKPDRKEINRKYPLNERIAILLHRFKAKFLNLEFRRHGFEVFIDNKDDVRASKIFPTIDEAFQLIKDVEDGKY